MLGEWKQRLWSSSQGNLKLQSGGGGRADHHHQMMSGAGGTLTSGTKFSALVGGTLSGGRGGTVQRRAQANKQARQMQAGGGGGGDFKVGEIEAGSGKRSVRSLQGVQRNSEVLYVGTFSNNGDPLKRGKITDVFDVVGEEAEETALSDQEDGGAGRQLGAAMRHQRLQRGGGGTMSRSYSQPDFMVNRDDDGVGEEEEDEAEPVSEEVIMQRPVGLFDRPMLGSLAFRRSVSAALSELQPDTSSVGSSNHSSHKSNNGGLKQRSHLVISDSDSEGTASTDEDEEDAENGYTSLGRFLAAWGLEEHMHM